jgi:hypothetical protein
MPRTDLTHILDNPEHHAYLIIGNAAEHFDAFRLALRKKIAKGGLLAADVSTRAYESLNIDDAREIKEVQNTMPIGERRFVLISLESIQHEAQNSLLKLFEESVHSVFIICARHPSIFLPTLLSRFYILESGGNSVAKTDVVSMSDFLAGSVSDRLAQLEPIIKEKDKAQAEHFLNDLEVALHKSFVDSGRAQGFAGLFENIFSARRFLRSRSPSVKMILENLAGIVPRIKLSKN